MKRITIELYREQLLYDISNIAFVEGDIMRVDDEHQRHQVMDVVEDGNIDLVSRYIELAYSECVESLYAYSKRDVEDEHLEHDTLRERSVLRTELSVPDNFSSTTHERIARLMHEFIVSRVLSLWFGTSYPEKSAYYRALSDGHLSDINKSKNMRSKVVLRKLAPW